MTYSNFTDAELRAHLGSNFGTAEDAVDEAAKRFCDTTGLDALRKNIEKVEIWTALLESHIVDVSTCIADIRDYLQRTTE